ncbi:MAG: hypothetical protein QOF91_2376, partial [Alphaproteobacteria bacterium]|nr:hypothetical protein [Alphaproteobacteria bacterium]
MKLPSRNPPRYELFCPMRPPVLIVLHGELSTPGR